MVNYIYQPDHNRGLQCNDLGGKARNLLLLRESGVRVPRWFAVVGRGFRDIVVPALAEIQPQWQNDLVADNVHQLSQRAQQLIANIELPQALVQQVDTALSALRGSSHVAVRSSATVEDAADHSCAGLFTTFLYVPRAQVMDCIRRAWAAAYSASAIHYMRQWQLSSSQFSMAVIVQNMVDGDKSGVLFQADVSGRLDESVLVAGYGLGEGIVNNRVPVDTIRWNNASGVTEAEIATKTSKLGFNRSAGRGLAQIPVPPHRQKQPVLTPAELEQLREASARIGRVCREPQDIEWVIDGQGRLYITQTRPISGLPPGPIQLYDNTNIVEGYPGISSPLTISFVKNAYQANFRNTFRLIHVPEEVLQANRDSFAHMIESIQGRIYYNLSNWYRIFALLPGGSRLLRPFDDMIGASSADGPAEARGTKHLAASVRSLAYLGKHFIRHETLFSDYKSALHIAVSTATHRLQQAPDNRALVALYHDFFHAVYRASPKLLLNDFYLMVTMAVAKSILSRLDIDDVEQTLNALLSDNRGLESLAPVDSVRRLANDVRHRPALKALLESNDCHSLSDIPAQYADFRSACEDHMAQFGDRGIAELKLETPGFRQSPNRLIRLILANARSDTAHPPRSDGNAVQHEYAKAYDKLRAAVHGSRFRMRAILFLLAKLRHLIRNREAGRLDRARKFAVFRDIFQRIAENWLRDGIIGHTDDVFYLTVDEIVSQVDRLDREHLQATVASRKRQWRDYEQCRPVDRMWLKGEVGQNTIPQQPSVSSPKPKPDIGQSRLRGVGCCPGFARGAARVLQSPREDEHVRGHILVTESTDPGWVYLMMSAAGLIVEKGNILSHTAIIGRELGIPTIIGVADATAHIEDGVQVEMDGASGLITWGGGS